MSAPHFPLQLDATEYMHERRPQWVTERIEHRKTEASEVRHRPYAKNGEVSDYTFVGERSVGAMGLLREQEMRLGRKLKVLDIGAAAGAFTLRVLGEGHEGYGLSLHDYRDISLFADISNQLPTDAYLVGDAHKLHDIPQIPDDLDVIVSHWAFFHFVDCLSVLEQAADKLAKDGIFAADGIGFPSPRIYTGHDDGDDIWSFRRHAYTALATAGFRSYGDESGEPLEDTVHAQPFIIEREAVLAPVRIAVDYRQAPPY